MEAEIAELKAEVQQKKESTKKTDHQSTDQPKAKVAHEKTLSKASDKKSSPKPKKIAMHSHTINVSSKEAPTAAVKPAPAVAVPPSEDAVAKEVAQERATRTTEAAQPHVAIANTSASSNVANSPNVNVPKKEESATQQQDSDSNAAPPAPVSLAAFYDEQDVHDPLREGKPAKTMDLSGDNTAMAPQLSVAQVSERKPPTWWSSLISWFTGTPAEAPLPKPVQKRASLLDARKIRKQVVHAKQNSSLTALAAFDDSQHTISISESFGDLERQDEDDEIKVEHEDAAARTDAETKEPVPQESPEQLKQRQVHISNVFSALEEEDDQITASLQNTDDLSEYSRLSNLQDSSMAKLSAELTHADKMQRSPRPLLKREDKSFEAKPMHDPWRTLEKEDLETESKLKRNPNLRMLQMSDSIQHH